MEKIDINATRAAILKAYDQIEPSPDDSPEAVETIKLMKRAAPMIAEVQVFCLQEMERATRDDVNAMAVLNMIGDVLGTALHSVCQSVEDAKPPAPGEMTAAHTAIHVVTEALDHSLHDLYNTAEDGDGEHEGYHRAAIDIVRREVGDA